MRSSGREYVQVTDEKLRRYAGSSVQQVHRELVSEGGTTDRRRGSERRGGRCSAVSGLL